jgi:hypothetical protein
MKTASLFRLFVVSLLALAALVWAGVSGAQTVPGRVDLTWTNPTTSIDGVPLTGANALTGIEVHWATAPIADTDLTRAAQITLPPTAQTTQQTIQVANGSTLYFRLRSVRGTEKSAFSNQASKLIQLSTVPKPPENLQLNLVITADGSLVIDRMGDVLAQLDRHPALF